MDELLNLNTANLDQLLTLPGIGKALAERIIASRPYEVVEDLQSVSGIGAAAFERLAPLVAVADDLVEVDAAAKEADPVPDEAEIDDGAASDAAAEAEDESSVDVEADAGIPEDGLSPEREEDRPAPEVAIPDEKTRPTRKPKTVTRGQVWLYSLVSSFLGLVLALIISLSILAGINGGLTFVRPAQLSALNRDLEITNAQIQILQQDLADIQTKVGSLEIDDTRLDQIEQDVESVVEASHILVSEMENIRLEANRFQGFLDSLMELLNNLNETETAIP